MAKTWSSYGIMDEKPQLASIPKDGIDDKKMHLLAKKIAIDGMNFHG